MTHSSLSRAVIGALAVLLTLASTTYAVDGVIEINQAVVTSSGGFPFTISSPGSYRLTSNLTVDDVNHTAIIVSTVQVTIDLNGFTIIGPDGMGTGDGIFTTNQSVAIKNGGIRNVGRDGISGGGVIDDVVVSGSGRHGISVLTRSVVRNSRSLNNVGTGIVCADKCRIADNVVEGNDGNGITATTNAVVTGNNVTNNAIGIAVGSGGIVTGNTASNNSGIGILATPFCVIDTNTVVSNGSHGISTQGTYVSSNMVRSNTGTGVLCADSCVISDNTIGSNNVGVTSFAASLISNNVIRGNTSFGLSLQSGASADTYVGNNLSGNNGANPETNNLGVELGQNVCNGTLTCP